MRLARAAAAEKPDEALKTLDGIKGEGWALLSPICVVRFCSTKAISKARARPGKLA
jgi:hypothetical protein